MGTPIGDVRLPLGGEPARPSVARPFGINARASEAHVYSGTAALMCSGAPAGLRQGTSASLPLPAHGSVPLAASHHLPPQATRSLSSVVSQVTPPPYEPPLTPIRAGSATPASTMRPISHWASRIS